MKVLIVEDDNELREALLDTLTLHSMDVCAAASAEEAIGVLDKKNIDIIVSDVSMPGMNGYDLLQYVSSKFSHIPCLLMTAYAAVDRAVEAMQQGAVDYLVKPFEPKQLIELIKKHVPVSADEHEKNQPIAVDEHSKKVLRLAKKVAKTDSTVLILGESGTGKEVLARYLHQCSDRHRGPFIAINCAAIPENMLEATLFGHEKGAFTGAIASAAGKFEQANGGTLLLDEISEMDLNLQAKLLRVLQEKEVERVGGRKVISLDVRVLATSNRSLSSEVSAGHFREDLYYRLNVFTLGWQPLRLRKDDILPLSERILRSHGRKMNKERIQFDSSACHVLLNYPWPGNVRELDNAIQRALILQTGLYISDLDLGLSGENLIDFQPNHSLKSDSQAASLEENVIPQGMQEGLKTKEFELILEALKIHKGRKNKAADYLGISSRTLRYKLAKMREIGMNVDQAIAQLR